MSGLIFVALALVWAVVLIPKALRHHDEEAETRSVDGVSDAMRVLARREPVNPRQARLVVHPEGAGSPGRGGPPADLPSASGSTISGPSTATSRVRMAARRRRAAAVAARRRRHVLVLLLLVTAGIGAAAGLGLLQPWSPGIPGGVVLAFLVLARVTVRRENARWERQLAAVGAALEAERRAPAGPAAEPEAHAPRSVHAEVVDEVIEEVVEEVVEERNDQGVSVVSGLDDTASFPVGLLGNPAPSSGASALWDPLPVTLPTYVTKPRATRSVRTIDLTAPGVASSGRDAAASALVAEAATSTDPDGATQRAVGS